MGEVKEIEDRARRANEIMRNKNPLEWKDPEPINTALLPVPPFAADLLPGVLRRWVEDCAERMDRMPLDFPAVAIVTAIAGILGRRVAIYPKRNDNWYVAPNIWGAVIGRPSTKKTPSLKEALRFPQLLESACFREHQEALADYEAGCEADKLYREAMKADLKKQAKTDKSGAKQAIMDMAADESEMPIRARYIVNDSTIEKLGELMQENPSGLLLFRDELTGWLNSLEKSGREQDRAFFLEAWNGTGSFTWDRIDRGTVYVPSVCLSVLGGIQPAKIGPYLRSMNDGAGDDGLLQRFQLLVWPDAPRPEHTDKSADQEAWDAVMTLFRRLGDLNAFNGEDQVIFRFDDSAQDVFDDWYRQMLIKEHDEPNPHIEAHLTKYHSLMPSLALIFQLVDGDGGSVGDEAATRATVWCDYLEAHARRVYATASDPYHGARQLISKLDKLPNPFRREAFNNKGWSGLTCAAEIDAALDVLVQHNFIREMTVETGTKPATDYYINPHARKNPQ